MTNRVEAINAFYTNDDIDEALTFLDRYSVKYVVVGEYELAYYPFEGLDKLRRMVDMDLLQVAYKNDGVVIYEHFTDSGTKVN